MESRVPPMMCRVGLLIGLPAEEEEEVTEVSCWPQPGDSLVVLLRLGADGDGGTMLQLNGTRGPAEASQEVLFKAEYIMGVPERKYALLASVPEYGLETRCSVRQGKALVEIRAEGWDPETRVAYSIQVRFQAEYQRLGKFLEHWGGLFGVQIC